MNPKPFVGLSGRSETIIVRHKTGGTKVVPTHKAWEALLELFPDNSAAKSAFRLGMAYQKHCEAGRL